MRNRTETLDGSKRYLGQILLLALIAFYRRYLSGRGPLRKVSCTFHGSESCSSYGLRVVAEATSFVGAFRLIIGRIRRCGRTSLYYSKRSFLWDGFYDRPWSVIEQELRGARESSAAIDAVHSHCALVAHLCARSDERICSKRTASALAIRAWSVWHRKEQRARNRATGAMGFATVIFLPAIFWGLVPLYLVSGTSMLMAVFYAGRYRRLHARLSYFEIAEHFA